jgi:hypothetical protein
MNSPFLAAALLAVAIPASANGDALFAGQLQSLRLAIKPALTQVASIGSEEQTFLDALNSRRPEDRVQALKGLKRFVPQSSRARDAVLDHLGYYSEAVEVRREAARALTWGAGDSRVRDALLSAAKGYSNPLPVRAMAWKALYWQAQYDSRVRDDMRDAADRESNGEVRLAAIWALMYAGGDSRTRDFLLDTAKRSYDKTVAAEAFKSLYSQSRDSNVRDFVRDTAKRGSGELRYTAIMMLAERWDSSDTDLLSDIAKRDNDDQARRYALISLNGFGVEVINYFHLNQYTWRNGYSQLISEAIDRE